MPLINLNAASADQLDAIPPLRGHGFEIVRYRDERGRFETLRQLDEVPGLAGKTAGVGGARYRRMTVVRGQRFMRVRGAVADLVRCLQ